MKHQPPKLKTSTFDATSAKCIRKRVAGSPHDAYKDDNGAVCLLCVGSSPGGGVAVNESALNWLREQPGARVVRIKNKLKKLDITIPLDDLPEKQMRDGEYGRYAFFDSKDFGSGPPFPEQEEGAPM
jgi:hypothetical protein